MIKVSLSKPKESEVTLKMSLSSAIIFSEYLLYAIDHIDIHGAAMVIVDTLQCEVTDVDTVIAEITSGLREELA